MLGAITAFITGMIKVMMLSPHNHTSLNYDHRRDLGSGGDHQSHYGHDGDHDPLESFIFLHFRLSMAIVEAVGAPNGVVMSMTMLVMAQARRTQVHRDDHAWA